ncbi:MAG: DUF4845 domain-containing protein [Terriglobia bacterium]
MGYKLAGERGGSRLRVVIALLLTAVFVLVLVRLVPVYVKDYAFKDAMRQEAMRLYAQNTTPVKIRQRLLREARELGIQTIRPEQIQVVPARGGVRISVNYSVPVELIVYTLTLNFQTSVDTSTAY